MIGHIDAIRMHNIQSWGEDNNILEFEFQKINVIIARNETGKSVMFKVFRQMCFPNFFGRNGRKDLIKKDKEFGQADILTADGHTVTFIMFGKSQKYILTTPEGQQQDWVQDFLPSEIQSVLGWYIDTEHKILLNIIDHEISMPLVETESSFNAKVLRFVVEHQVLEESVIRQKEWSNELKELLQSEENAITLLGNKLSMIPYTDLDAIAMKIKEVKLYTQAMFSLQEVIGATKDYNTQVSDKVLKEPLTTIEDESITTIMETLPQLDSVKESLKSLHALTKPTFNFIDEDEYHKVLTVGKQVQDVRVAVSNVYRLQESKKPEPVVDDDIGELMKVRGTLFYTSKAIDELLSTVNRKEFIDIELYNTNIKVNQLEEEMGICPLCSKPFEEHDKTHLTTVD